MTKPTHVTRSGVEVTARKQGDEMHFCDDPGNWTKLPTWQFPRFFQPLEDAELGCADEAVNCHDADCDHVHGAREAGIREVIAWLRDEVPNMVMFDESRQKLAALMETRFFPRQSDAERLREIARQLQEANGGRLLSADLLGWADGIYEIADRMASSE